MGNCVKVLPTSSWGSADVTGGKLFMCLPIHLQLASPITRENGGRKKNKPLHGAVAESFAEAAIIAFPEQKCFICAASARQRTWYS